MRTIWYFFFTFSLQKKFFWFFLAFSEKLKWTYRRMAYARFKSCKHVSIYECQSMFFKEENVIGTPKYVQTECANLAIKKTSIIFWQNIITLNWEKFRNQSLKARHSFTNRKKQLTMHYFIRVMWDAKHNIINVLEYFHSSISQIRSQTNNQTITLSIKNHLC
jgi:hypothetical protein